VVDNINILTYKFIKELFKHKHHLISINLANLGYWTCWDAHRSIYTLNYYIINAVMAYLNYFI